MEIEIYSSIMEKYTINAYIRQKERKVEKRNLQFNDGLQEGDGFLNALNVGEGLYKCNRNHEEEGKEEECDANNKLPYCK